MKMRIRNLIFAILLGAPCMTAHAQQDENLLQILPVALDNDGKTKILEVEMNNTYDFLALQFNIYLPEGISLRSTGKPHGTLPKDRFPYTEEYDELEDVTTTEFKHLVQYASHDGYTTFVISPNDLSYIKGYSGTLLRIYVNIDADLKPGLYPIKFDNVRFTKYEDKKMVTVYGPQVSTFVIVGDTDISSTVDLSALTGYMPFDVCGAVSTWLADKADVSEIDLTGLDEGGQALTIANPNALLYVKGGSAFGTTQKEGRGANVVEVGDEGNTCDRLTLTDGHAFSASRPFHAAEASYTRTVPAAGWYSLCLPYTANVPADVTVERFSSIDTDGGTITFAEAAPEANVPCIFNTTGTEVEFAASEVDVVPQTEALTDGPMAGTYVNIAAGAIEGKYALHSDGSGFGIAGATASVPPFRAYLNTESQAKTIRLIHDQETAVDETVRTDGLRIAASEGSVTVKAGAASEISIAAADGRRVAAFRLSAGESRTVSLCAGVYIINNTKILIK